MAFYLLQYRQNQYILYILTGFTEPGLEVGNVVNIFRDDHQGLGYDSSFLQERLCEVYLYYGNVVCLQGTLRSLKKTLLHALLVPYKYKHR